MGKFKKAKSKAQKTRRHREADERTAAEASAADADGHADSNAGDADDAGAQSSSGGGGSSSGGGSGGELKVNLWSLISSAESNHIFDIPEKKKVEMLRALREHAHLRTPKSQKEFVNSIRSAMAGRTDRHKHDDHGVRIR